MLVSLQPRGGVGTQVLPSWVECSVEHSNDSMDCPYVKSVCMHCVHKGTGTVLFVILVNLKKGIAAHTLALSLSPDRLDESRDVNPRVTARWPMRSTR